MREIKLLDKDTIDKIAAGEVVERPASVVKELLENSIDSGATRISAEIKNSGTDLIRVTDDGCGLPKDQIRIAFVRHCTSKIENARDLANIRTLGFRGEALASICAVCRMEILTKTKDSLTGAIYRIEGGQEVCLEDAGLPDGTTVVVRDLFYNVPARLKFLKSPRTEAAYIAQTVERLALAHPEISFKFTANSALKLLTSGKGDLKDTIHSVFGREISSSLLEVNGDNNFLKLTGYIGKPEISRPSRSLENYSINGRYVKDAVVAKALEDSFRGFQMKGTFPFCCLNIEISPDMVDVNVHPSKMEVKFSDSERVYAGIYGILSGIISSAENIPALRPSSISKSSFKALNNTHESTQKTEPRAENAVIEDTASGAEAAKTPRKNTPPAVEINTGCSENKKDGYCAVSQKKPQDGGGEKETKESTAAQERETAKESAPEPFETERLFSQSVLSDFVSGYDAKKSEENPEREHSNAGRFISRESIKKTRIIGQVFETYWICEFEDKMYIIDQHAAHEKVLYEKFRKMTAEGEVLSQSIYPEIVVSLSPSEALTLENYMEYFRKSGFEIESFGGMEYLISAVPATLYSSIDSKALFLDTLKELSSSGAGAQPDILLERTASAACRAAVKGNSALSFKEAQELIDSLLSLENPYNCPHGRPTIISMSKYELERKFKRIT